MSATAAPPLTVAEAMRIVRDDRFFAKVEDQGACWTWVGCTTADGYGRLTRGSRQHMAHRWLFARLVCPIESGLTLDHLCRNRACVNPAHLEPVSLRDNILRGEGVGVRNAAKTHCVHGHEFTPENTYIKQGKRSCRECGRQANRRHRAKVEAA